MASEKSPLNDLPLNMLKEIAKNASAEVREAMALTNDKMKQAIDELNQVSQNQCRAEFPINYEATLTDLGRSFSAWRDHEDWTSFYEATNQRAYAEFSPAEIELWLAIKDGNLTRSERVIGQLLRVDDPSCLAFLSKTEPVEKCDMLHWVKLNRPQQAQQFCNAIYTRLVLPLYGKLPEMLLMWAIRSNQDLNEIKRIGNKLPDYFFTTEKNTELLQLACESGNRDAAHYLLELLPEKLQQGIADSQLEPHEKEVFIGGVVQAVRSSVTVKALQSACEQSDPRLVEILLKHGATADSDAMLAALKSGNNEVVDVLVKHGVDIHAELEEGTTFLHECCKQGNVRAVTKLLELGAKMDVLDEDGFTPSMCAYMENYPNVVKTLLMKDPDVVKHDMQQQPGMLGIICNYQYPAMIELLLEKGADPNVLYMEADDDSDSEDDVHLIAMTPLREVCKHRHDLKTLRVAEVLLRHGADVNKAFDNGKKPLDMLCEKDQAEDPRVLFQNYDELTDELRAQMEHAAKDLRRDFALIALFLKYDATVSKEFLSKVIKNKDFELLAVILKNVKPDQCPTLDRFLLGALKYGDSEAAKLLLENGANPNAVSSRTGKTAAFYALSSREISMIPVAKLLLTKPGVLNELFKDANKKIKDAKIVMKALLNTYEIKMDVALRVAREVKNPAVIKALAEINQEQCKNLINDIKNPEVREKLLANYLNCCKQYPSDMPFVAAGLMKRFVVALNGSTPIPYNNFLSLVNSTPEPLSQVFKLDKAFYAETVLKSPVEKTGSDSNTNDISNNDADTSASSPRFSRR